MLSPEKGERLTRVGPDAPMGKLLRYYWHPVCAVDELARSRFRTKEITILGEELVLYRDRSGALGIIDKYCAHRRTNLALGVVESDGLRCPYHGWKYNQRGECVEQPFEDLLDPGHRFRKKCGLRAYRAEELAGIVFAYLGPDPAPLLPRWAPLVWEQAVRDITTTVLPCNWLQCQENSLDPVHAEWLHAYAGSYFSEILHGREPTFQRRLQHKKIGFGVFEHGVIKRRVTGDNDEASSEWTVGHPALFPNILVQGDKYQVAMQFRVPMDDTRTFHLTLYTFPAAPGAVIPRQETIPSREIPLRNEDGSLRVDRVFHQDYAVWIGQGPIVERHLEKLGRSDEGIVLFRGLLDEELGRVANGGSPSMNVFRDPASNVCIELPIAPSFDGKAKPRYGPREAGTSRDLEQIEAVLSTWK